LCEVSIVLNNDFDTGVVKNYANRTIEKIVKLLGNATTTLKPLSVSEISNQINNEVPELVVNVAKKPEQENIKTLTHQGTVIKVSKKAWKLEMERKKQEKLRRLDEQTLEPSNLI
jgi:hypothetical protein